MGWDGMGMEEARRAQQTRLARKLEWTFKIRSTGLFFCVGKQPPTIGRALEVWRTSATGHLTRVPKGSALLLQDTQNTKTLVICNKRDRERFEGCGNARGPKLRSPGQKCWRLPQKAKRERIVTFHPPTIGGRGVGGLSKCLVLVDKRIGAIAKRRK